MCNFNYLFHCDFARIIAFTLADICHYYRKLKIKGEKFMNDFLEDLLFREVLKENKQFQEFMDDLLTTKFHLGQAVFEKKENLKD